MRTDPSFNVRSVGGSAIQPPIRKKKGTGYEAGSRNRRHRIDFLLFSGKPEPYALYEPIGKVVLAAIRDRGLTVKDLDGLAFYEQVVNRRTQVGISYRGEYSHLLT